MQWLKRLLARAAPPAPLAMVGGFPVPWVDSRPSLFGYLASFPLEADGRLPKAAATLPDEEMQVSRSGSTLRWAAGAMDGVLGHHVAAGQEPAVAKALAMLEDAVRTRAPEQVKDFYDLVNTDQVLALIDPLLQAVRASSRADARSLHAFAQWLACESPDRGAVKVGIALLGLLHPPQDTQTLLRLGMHDEFTLFAAVALANTLGGAEGEDALWSLARCVDGWGRIHLVERLAGTSHPPLKAWLLREGYKNSVMYEYLAFACATGGGLRDALEPDAVDGALLDGAGDLIQALLNGGPAEDIRAYGDGAEVLPRYLTHAARRASPPLQSYLVVADIAKFVGDAEQDWQTLEPMGWSADLRQRVAEQAAVILGASNWPGHAIAGLESADGQAFWTAASVAERLGLDIWEARLERQRSGQGDQWFDLMRTGDADRVDRVIDLATSQLDLASIATGPAEAMGMGAEYRQHTALDFLLQSLDAFPGKGWHLVAAGLRSPVVRNRSMSLKVVEAWGRNHWPDGAHALLARAHDEEPRDDLRSRLAALLAVEGR